MKLNKMHWSYTPETGTFEGTVYCGVCNAKLDVEKNKTGATAFAEAMAGKTHQYDLYTCPNHKELWHIQISLLQRELKDTASKTISDMLEKEIEQIHWSKSPTKTKEELSIPLQYYQI